jgi:iron-sulfur cluster assembly protein
MNEVIVESKPEVEGEIMITPRAIQEIQRIKEDNRIPASHALRLGVKGGGCSGFSYVLAFDDKPREGDKVFEIGGITVHVDPKSLFYLAGTTLEFSDGLNGRGFVFKNPNAQRTCGCGSSFGV